MVGAQTSSSARLSYLASLQLFWNDSSLVTASKLHREAGLSKSSASLLTIFFSFFSSAICLFLCIFHPYLNFCFAIFNTITVILILDIKRTLLPFILSLTLSGEILFGGIGIKINSNFNQLI